MKQTDFKTYQVTTESAFLLSLDVLKLFYDSAQKRMSDYQQQAGETTERAYKVIAIYATLLTLLCAYVFAHPAAGWQMLPVWLLLAGTGISTAFMLKVVMPRHYMPLGHTLGEMQPNTYAADFTTDGESVDDDMQMRLILRDELNQLEYSIRWQEQSNIRRTRLFGWSLKAVFSGILASMSAYFLLLISL